MEDEIFSISRAARYLGVFTLTLRNWEKKGKIRAFRTPGGHRRFRRSNLDDLLGIENEKGDRLRTTIRGLELLSFSNKQHKEMKELMENLKDIAEEL